MAARNRKYCISATLLATSMATMAVLANPHKEACSGSSVFDYFTASRNCEIDRSAPAMHGPFQFIVEYSDNTGYTYDPKYTNDLGSSDAIAVEFAFGPNTFRPAVTWGHAFTDDVFTKITLEYLAQRADFEFIAANAALWKGQWEVGADVRYRFSHQLGLESFHVGVQYVKAESEDLSPVTFDIIKTNLRALKGGMEEAFIIGVRVQPWTTGYFDLDLHYDALAYRRVYQPENNASGIGVSFNYHQNLGERWQFVLSAADRRPYYEYFGRLKWIARHSSGSLLEIASQISFNGGNAALGRENRFGLGIFYSWGGDMYSSPVVYNDPLNRGLRQELVDYTNDPAVRTPQVFVTTDQKVIP